MSAKSSVEKQGTITIVGFNLGQRPRNAADLEPALLAVRSRSPISMRDPVQPVAAVFNGAGGNFGRRRSPWCNWPLRRAAA